jgi:hypothetical protein
MKKILALFILVMAISGCKKIFEQIAQDAIIQAMTSGQWVITSFTRNGTNVTSSFTGYKFQYYSNKTVDAIKNGTVEKTGTWDGNANTMTTWANFPNVPEPLSLINGNWKIDNNSWTFVVASQNNGTEAKTMRLEKQ